MQKRTRGIFGLLVAVVVLAAAAAIASANRIETSEQAFLVLFREITFEAGGQNVICAVNYEGSFHSKTIAKVNESLIGYVTEAVIHLPCQNGSGTVLTSTLPWHIHYESFTGTLPNITGTNLRLDNGGYRVNVAGVICLYEFTATNPMRGTVVVSGGTVTGLRANETARVRLKEGGLFCPSEGIHRGTGNVGTQSGWSSVVVRLVQ
jgi:hypothetical protein